MKLWIKKGLALGGVFFLAVLLVKPIGVSTHFSVLSGIFHSALGMRALTPTTTKVKENWQSRFSIRGTTILFLYWRFQSALI